MKLKGKIVFAILLMMAVFFGITYKSNADTVRLGPKYDGLWHYKLNEYTNMNLFCAQEGGSLSSHYANTYTKSAWGNVGIFKSENDYKKITWIKNHIWEQTDKNLYSDDEILSILKASGRNVSMDDVTNVFGSQNKKFKLYQLISWRYTNGNYVNPSNYLGTNTSIRRVYDAIVELAEKNYNNVSEGQDELTVTPNSNNPVKGSGTITWNFTVSTNNPAQLITEVYENGNVLQSNRVNVSRNGNQLTIVVNDYDSNQNNTYQIIIKQAQVIAKGTIYTHRSTQNMILINTERKEKTYTYSETIEGASGEFSLKIKKIEKIDENINAVPGIKFNVTGSAQLSEQATGTNGELQIVPNGTTLESGQEFNYEITEIEDKNSNYVALKDPIKVKLIAGTAKDSNGKKYYCITYAKFLSGKTKETVELINGKEVDIEIKNETSNTENKGTSIITITVENVKKEFDLALTKTIKEVDYNYLSSISLFDTTHEAYQDLTDSEKKGNAYIISKINVLNSTNVTKNILNEIGVNIASYEDINKAISDISKWGIEDCTEQDAINKYVPTDKQNQATKFDVFVYALRQKGVPILTPDDLKERGIDASKFLDALDLNMDGIIDLDDTYENLVEVDNSNQNFDYSRLNDIDTSNLNKNGETTAIYNLDKSPVEITKEGEICYEIKVYNEGDIDAKNIKITDYIPKGLSVIDIQGNVITSGEVTYNITDDYSVTWNITENSDGTKTATTTVLEGNDDVLESYRKDDLKSIYVEIRCRVDSTAETGTKYYNVAEITGATAVTAVGDRDSAPKNFDDYKNVEGYYNDVDGLINDYSDNYNVNFAGKSYAKSNKDEYDYEDDDDFEVILVRDRIFDLALRKSITKVGTAEGYMKDVTYDITDSQGNEKTINRLPKITLDSGYYCRVNGTGAYYHKKEAVPVNVNDYVEYTIRVYNEGSYGDYAGYASQITDYLPEGLEFHAIVNQDGTWQKLGADNTAEQADNTNEIGKFKATYDKTNNKIQLDYIEGKYNVVTPQEALLQIYSSESVGKELITYYTTEAGKKVNKVTYAYQEVKIVCKVKDELDVIQDNATTKNYLTNVAAITEEKVSTRDGVVVSSEDTVLDRDSVQTPITIGDEYDKQNQKVNLKTYYTTDCNDGTGVNDAFIEYYEGIEDDDDFETVVLNKFEVDVEKVDGQGNPIEGIEFTASPLNDTLGNNEKFQKNDTPITDKEGKTWLAVISMPHTLISNPCYEMELQESANDSYITMQDKFYIAFYYNCDDEHNINGIDYIKVYLNSFAGNYLELNEEDNYQGTIDVTMTDGSTETATVTWDGSKLLFRIVNKPIVENPGTYNLQIKKVNTKNNPVGGAIFTVNGTQTDKTDSQKGIVKVVSNVPINSENVNNDDSYEITEVSVDGNSYEIMEGSIKVIVKKEAQEADDGQINYVLSSVEIEGGTTNSDGVSSKEVTLTDGTKVTATAKIVKILGIDTVSITIPNKEKSGEYEIKLVKYGNQGDTSEILQGVTFDRTATLNSGSADYQKDFNKVSLEPTDENGETVVTSNMGKDGGSKVQLETLQSDKYTLTESSLGTNTDYYKLPENIQIEVGKGATSSSDSVYVSSFVMTVGTESATINLVTGEGGTSQTITRNIDGQEYVIKMDVQKDEDTGFVTLVLTIEDPQIIIEEGKYKLKLRKTKLDGTRTVPGVTFQLIGGNIEGEALKDASGNDITTENPKDIITKRTLVDVYNESITINDAEKSDTYILKEYSVGDNADIYNAFEDDEIKIQVNKKSTTEGNHTINSIDTVQLFINNNEITETDSDGKLVYEKTMSDGQVAKIKLSYSSSIVLSVEDPAVTEEGEYKLKLLKTKMDGTAVEGVIFNLVGGTSQGAKLKNNSGDLSESNPHSITTEETAVNIWDETITITNIEEADTYILKEHSVGNNADIYNAFENDIITINVNKTSSTDGIVITNSIDSIDLIVTNGIGVPYTRTEGENSITYTKKLPDGQTPSITLTRDSDDTLTLSVENPQPKNGLYNIVIEKVDDKGNPIIIEKEKDRALFKLQYGHWEANMSTGTIEFVEDEVQISKSDDEYEVFDQTKERATERDGTLAIGNIAIDDSTTEANWVIEEIKAPLGYNKIEGKIKIPLTFEADETGDGYKVKFDTESASLIKDGTETDLPEGIAIELNENSQTIKITIENTLKSGKFDIDLIKYVQGTTIPLPGAEFTVSVKEQGTEKELADTSKTYTTGDDGKFTEKVVVPITDEGKKYTITVTETGVPEGYEGLEGPVVFNATSKLSDDGKSYVLIPEELTTVANSKKVTVTEDEVLIEAENIPEGPHKGVKEVNNQDSGYYDEVTGAVYTDEEEIESTLHDWVITTKIPSGIDKYAKYIITDTIDERLDFSGIENVKIAVLNGETLEQIKTLAKDEDYKVSYDETTRTLKVSFIEDNFRAGESLTPGTIVEIRFNTTFAKDEDGNIIAINQSVENQATLTYGDSQGNEVSKETENPEVHTGGVGLYKYDKKTGKALEGAKFKIATSRENAENGIFVKDANGNDIEKITNEKGIAVFDGLEFGEDALEDVKYQTGEYIYGQPVYAYNWEEVQTTYYIVETESPVEYIKIEEPIEAVVKKDNYDINDIETLIKVGNEPKIYDLSLRKFITAVKNGATQEEEKVTTRIPQVDITNLVNETSTTATYTHPKDPVLVHTTDTVTYTIRVYNEGPQDAYASIIKDDIPDGLELVTYTEGDGSINDTYKWKFVDENDNEVTDSSKAKYIITDYLSKESGEKVMAEENLEENPYLLKGFTPETMTELDYRDVQVQFKVVEPTTSDRILINYAQISKETDKDGTSVTDRDSTPNEWIDTDDDQDIEKVRVLYFDLALRKWVTQAIVTENGQTVITETGHKAEDNPEEVVKVDLKKSKLKDVTVKFKYSIRITNEGEIAGEATEIRDDIPNGLKFVAEDNPDWRAEDGKIVTDKLAGTTLQPGESAEVEIILTWVNSEDNMGVMINTAEISKDHNDYGTPDIDSTPGNYVPGEDDIDDAPVMLTVKTGTDMIMYMSLGLVVIAIVGVGIVLIKENVVEE